MTEPDAAGEPPSPRPRRRSGLPAWIHSTEVHEWIRSVGIVVAFAWGMYTFIWKEIVVPELAPASLSLQVTLAPTGRTRPGAAGQPANVELRLEVTAKNPSARKLHLLANPWQLSGVTVVARGDNPDFAATLNDTLAAGSTDQVQRHAALAYSPPLASGLLFPDDVIHPGETLTRNLLLYVPATYQAAAVDVLIPGLTRPPSRQLWDGESLRWGFSADEALTPLLCRSPAKDPCRPVDLNTLDREMKRFDPRSVIFRADKQASL
jgi:hypothetical protein